MDSHEFSYLKSPWKLGQYWGCYTFWLDKLSWTICRFPITPSCEVRVSCPKIPRHISFPNVRAATASSLCWISIPVVCTWLNRIVTSIAAVTRQQVHRKLLLQWFCELLLVISFIRQSNGQKKSTQKSWFEIIQLMSYPRTPLKELMLTKNWAIKANYFVQPLELSLHISCMNPRHDLHCWWVICRADLLTSTTVSNVKAGQVIENCLDVIESYR